MTRLDPDGYNYPNSAYQAACDRIGLLESALTAAIEVADQARDEWDTAPQGMKAGKLLIALSGRLPGYRPDIDAIHRIHRGGAASPLGGPILTLDELKPVPIGGDGEGSSRTNLGFDGPRAASESQRKSEGEP